MDNSLLKSFIEEYHKDKEELNRKFEELSHRISGIDSKFESVDEHMGRIDDRLEEIEDVQGLIFGKLGGFTGKLDNVRVYLSTLETRLNQYRTLNLHGEKMLDGELYRIKIKLQKIKPIISWEDNEFLASKYKEIEAGVQKLEEGFEK